MIIKNGYIIDPSNKKEGVFDILIEGSKIKEVSKSIKAKDKEIIDAKKKIIIPGLIDMHVHLREPGREDIETVKSGTGAAISGGITSICSMPNTRLSMDNIENLELLKSIIKRDAGAFVSIIGAITKGREGKEIVDMKMMKEKGAIALSDDGNSIQDERVMLDALKKAKENGLLLISHCEDKTISKNGVVNEGIVATKLGLRGISKKAEYEFVGRDIELARKTKAKLHIAHVSCKESVDMIRKAKKDGVKVSAETGPQYFSLRDECCVTYDTRTKMNPPLRSAEDVEAIKKGLTDGTIDAIASDHAPHGKHEKEIEFDLAAFGIIGLETSLALAIMNLVETKRISWMRLVELMSANPAKILGLNHKGNLSPGSDADITIIDPEKKWVYTKDSIRSKSKNSPFIGWQFKGKVTGVIVGGRNSPHLSPLPKGERR
ncbi:MAG: dihydroorotase [Candidatus Omnitrophota bacterium]|nr:MAG: dihydroorotase [Candidatus Omnitrophota bacterium]